ncbi:MAG: nucleotide exchange factor GrpE [Desulfobacteraceae bacterium]|nr:nucleotide exchange factor GrpE [Desulfobacteraceae bacterium]
MPGESTRNKDEEIRDQAENEPEESASEDVREVLAKKDEELKQAQDRVLRLAAELDNTRKRLEREKSEGIAYANESLLKELIPVVDNLERAVDHGTEDIKCQALLDGVRMTLKSFLDVLAKFGASAFESVGQPFDPNRHEAVMQEESAEHPDMSVIKEFQKGYMLRDRLLRPAMVGVARNVKNA